MDIPNEKEQAVDELDGFKKDVKDKFKKLFCISGKSKSFETPRTESFKEFSETKTALVSSKHSDHPEVHKTKTASAPAPYKSKDQNHENTDIYNFNYPKRGLAIIINNEDFSKTKDFSDRPGSSRDAETLYDTFTRLSFDVVTYRDLTAKQMQALLQLATKKYDHSNADCFVCTVLTHGDQTWVEREYKRTRIKERRDLLFGVDGEAVPTKLVIESFNDDNCPGLAGKPRLFFFQACRGTKLDDGLDINVTVSRTNNIKIGLGEDGTDHSSSTDKPGEPFSSSVDPPKYHQKLGMDHDRTDAKPSVQEQSSGQDETEYSSFRLRDLPTSPAPLYKDCLVMYATPPGFLSWRRENGSWFIQSLCKVLDSAGIRSGTMPLVKALAQVSGYVGKYYESYLPEEPDQHAKKESPVLYSMLIKDVFLKKKSEESTQNFFFAKSSS
ncbi:unnamed protein product [Lymnaea stagnalis]|uniref:Uncharacterized protein n=1 Tax=Lymnaea stagnalis TaxID=6523 RepID=A0AAV2ICQ5_LYMST